MVVKSKKKKLKEKQIVKDDSSSEDQEDDVELTTSFNNDDTVEVKQWYIPSNSVQCFFFVIQIYNLYQKLIYYICN